MGIDSDDLDECRLWLRLGFGVMRWVGVANAIWGTACEAEARMERNRWFSSSKIFIASFKASRSEAPSFNWSSRSATFIRSSATILFACAAIYFISVRDVLPWLNAYLFKQSLR
jgi:hypothetical protein